MLQKYASEKEKRDNNKVSIHASTRAVHVSTVVIETSAF